MPNFIRGVPAPDSPIRSSEIRNNLSALDLRTNQVIPRATTPASKSLVVDSGFVYFQGKTPFQILATRLDLGDPDAGVQPFFNNGYFKDIAVVARPSFDESNRLIGSIIFLEGPEKSSNISEPQLVPISSRDIPIAYLLVRHNGIDLESKGQIEPIEQVSIKDARNFVDTGGTEYYSATVGDRGPSIDTNGVVIVDENGAPIIEGTNGGSFVRELIIDQQGSYREVRFSNPIKNAIESLGDSGGTILVRKGIYYISETITIPQNICLIGEGRSTQIVMSADFAGPMFNIQGSSVFIEKMSITGPLNNVSYQVSEATIKVENASFVTIRDCFLEDNLTDIQINSAQNISICNNYFLGSNQGIKILNTAQDCLVAFNHFSGFSTSAQCVQDVGIDSTTLGNMGIPPA